MTLETLPLQEEPAARSTRRAGEGGKSARKREYKDKREFVPESDDEVSARYLCASDLVHCIQRSCSDMDLLCASDEALCLVSNKKAYFPVRFRRLSILCPATEQDQMRKRKRTIPNAAKCRFCRKRTLQHATPNASISHACRPHASHIPPAAEHGGGWRGS